ncbi:AP3D1 [Bugula neritina]|uniref:AP3D1 n=1 Tax=Bugula neritina TaxID=10212 RepID=A0A7J7IZ13_BUGNE|nr:AP3D1 [Bugula neritina]
MYNNNAYCLVLVSISTDLPNHTTSVQLCVQKLRVLIEDSDQNLKYLGLLAFGKILKSHPKSVQAHKDLVLQCLDDRDESIRLRALDLLYGMVSKKNLMEIVRKLMVHMEKAEGTTYRDELMNKVIEICTQNNYQHVVNFEWYVSVLVELTKMKDTQHGKLLADHMMDVAIRVVAIRKFAVGQMAILLENSHLFAHNSQRKGICEILFAAAWLCGEYAELLPNALESLEAMFKPKVTSLPGHVQSVFVQNIVKLYSAIIMKAEVDGDEAKVREVGQILLDKLPMFAQSSDLEVQERACSALQLLKYIHKLLDKGVPVSEEVSFLFAGDLNPVAVKAQKKVPIPEGLDLDQWINKPPSKPVEVQNKASIFSSGKDDSVLRGESEKKRRKAKELSEEELKAQREARLQAQASNPHYLKLGGPSPRKAEKAEEIINVDDIPIETLDIGMDIEMSKGLDGLASSDKYYLEAMNAEKSKRKQKRKEGKKGKKGKKKSSAAVASDDEITPTHHVSSVVDMPEGMTAADSDNEDDDQKDEIIKKLDINLDDSALDLLSPPATSSSTVESAAARLTNGSNDASPNTSKKEKSRDKKKSKSSKRHKDKSLYEVAEGVTTPSKEHLSGTATPTNILDLSSLNLTNYRKLAADENLSMEFEARVSMQQANTLVVSVVFENLNSSCTLKSMDFNILDSMNTKLVRETSDTAVKVPFELMPLVRNEAQFVFSVQSLSLPQKLKGTLVYILKDQEGSSQQKLDFRLVIPCRDFLVAVPCSADSLAQLLAPEGQLTAKYSKRLTVKTDFKTTLAKLSFYAHAHVVEQMDNTASLYASSTQGHHVCLLVKLQGELLSIDGKSSDSSFLSNVIDEVTELLK